MNSNDTILVPTLRASGDVAYRRTDSWTEDGRGPPKVTIESLSDVALLEIFDFFDQVYHWNTDGWITLVHVCRRWRCIVFASPRRLNLQLLCNSRRSVKNMLDVWPALPMKIAYMGDQISNRNGADNILAAIGHSDRVSHIRLLNIRGSLLKRLAAVMQEPFPALTCLELTTCYKPPVLPDSFLGGSSPRLREIHFLRVPFPALPKLLLSASDLVILSLTGIPHSGYISPEAMVTGLSALTRLKHLHLGFRSPGPRFLPNEESRRLPLLSRVVLPTLSKLVFEGASEYLEDLVARTSAPLLEEVYISFFHQLVSNISEFHQFIHLAEKFKALDHWQAVILFCNGYVKVTLLPRKANDRTILQLRIFSRKLDRQLSSLARVRGSFLIPFANLGHLDIREDRYWRPQGQTDTENNQWLELLHASPSVENLCLSPKFAIRIAPAMQVLSEGRATGVLPALQNLFLRGPRSPPGKSAPIPEVIEQFVAVRRLSGNPVVVHHWKSGVWVVDTSADN